MEADRRRQDGAHTMTDGQQHEQSETLRAAQVKAARDILLQRVALLPGRGWTSEQLAAELVDAVMALAAPSLILPEVDPDGLADWERELLEAMEPQRITVLPEPAPDAEDVFDSPDVGRLPASDLLHIADLSSKAMAAQQAVARAIRDQAHAAGYAAAVANLRNANAVVTWLGNLPFTDRERADVPGQRGRNQLADYLEAVGPGAGDPDRRSAVPRSESPAQYVGDEP